MGCGVSKHGVHALTSTTSVVPAGAPCALAPGSAAAARKAKAGDGEARVMPPSATPSANVARARIEGVEARFRRAIDFHSVSRARRVLCARFGWQHRVGHTHPHTMRFVFSASLKVTACRSQGACAEPEPEVPAAPHTVEVSVRIQSLEALFRDLAQCRDAARLPAGPACAYELARVLDQTPTVAPMRVIPFAALRAASRAGRVSALADSPDGATVDVTELPEDARAKIILVSHRWWSSVNAQPDRVEHGWVRMRAALHATAMLQL